MVAKGKKPRAAFDLSTVKNRIAGHIDLYPHEIQDHPLQAWDHPGEQADALVGILGEVGIVDSLTVYKSERAGGAWVTVDGHLRKSLDANRQWPCKILEITDAEADYILLTRDRVGMMKRANAEALDALLNVVESSNAAVQQMIAEMAEEAGLYLDRVAGPDDAAEPAIDKVQELQARWQVQVGDIWQMGTHRLLCGDCTDAAAVTRLLGNDKPQVVFTSPPYWVGFAYEQEKDLVAIRSLIARFSELYTRLVSADGRIIINTRVLQAGEITKQPAHMRLMLDEWIAGLNACGWLMRYVRFWVKVGILLHTRPQSDCIDQNSEFIAYFYNPQAKFRGSERTSESWATKGWWDDIPGAAHGSGHIAAFPLEIPLRNILLFTRQDEVVMEPFAGSGTTILACEQAGRRCLAVELAPEYCALILQRWADTYGTEPERIDAVPG